MFLFSNIAALGTLYWVLFEVDFFLRHITRSSLSTYYYVTFFIDLENNLSSKDISRGKLQCFWCGYRDDTFELE